jgi:hypothetical protein
MIETQFAMNCNESCNDSALEVAPPRRQPPDWRRRLIIAPSTAITFRLTRVINLVQSCPRPWPRAFF